MPGLTMPGYQERTARIRDFTLGSAVVTDCAIEAEKICVTRFGRMPSFDSVHAASCNHFAVTFQNQVDLFFALVMVRKVCAAGSYFHDEKARQDSARRDAIAFAIDISHQQTVKCRRRMAAHGLRRNILRYWLLTAAVGSGAFSNPFVRKPMTITFSGAQRLITQVVRHGCGNIQIVFLFQGHVLASVFRRTTAFKDYSTPGLLRDMRRSRMCRSGR